jgi:hypothetical protein
LTLLTKPTTPAIVLDDLYGDNIMATTQRAQRELREARRELAEQPRARQELIQSFWATALRSAVEESKAAESVDELREWTELSGALLTLPRQRRPEVFNALLDSLRDAAERASGDEAEAAALEQWGRLQVLASYEQVREESHTVAWLEEHGISRQRLNQWRRSGRLAGIPDVPGVKGFAYPQWQFTDTLRPKDWLPRVLEAAAEARLDELALHRFMTNPEAGDGRSPLQAADSGDVETAVRLVAAANELGS